MWSKNSRIEFLEKEIRELRYRVLELEGEMFVMAPGHSYNDRSYRNSISLRQGLRALAQKIGVEIAVTPAGSAEAELRAVPKGTK